MGEIWESQEPTVSQILEGPVTPDDSEDPTTQLNYQIAEMIADTFGRSVEDFDIELADQIIAKVAAQPVSAETRQYAEHYRSARDAAMALGDDDASTQALDAETAYETAAVSVAEQLLFEIDHPS